jgi:hypothetical protein
VLVTPKLSANRWSRLIDSASPVYRELLTAVLQLDHLIVQIKCANSKLPQRNSPKSMRVAKCPPIFRHPFREDQILKADV